jgi:hypothetical protein
MHHYQPSKSLSRHGKAREAGCQFIVLQSAHNIIQTRHERLDTLLYSFSDEIMPTVATCRALGQGLLQGFAGNVQACHVYTLRLVIDWTAVSPQLGVRVFFHAKAPVDIKDLLDSQR